MSMRSAPPVDHTGIESGQGRSTWETLKRGVELSPEIRRGIGVTIALAVLSTVGKLLVPFVVQRTTDEGILAAGGPDAGIVLRYVLLAMVGVAVTALCSYFVNVRLFTASENGLSSLRIKAFRHIHDLSVLTQNTERRGSLVSRVTSDVDTISMFVQFGGLMFMVNIAQLLLATVLMVIYSPPLAGVVWACYVPLFFIIRQFQGIVGRAYTAVRERVGDMLAAISEAVVGAATIRAYGVEDRTAERIDTAVEAHRRSAVRAQTRAVMAFTTGQLVSGLTTAVVIVVGTLLAVNGSLTLGELLAFLFLVNLFTTPVQQATEILNEMQNAVAGWRRVIGIIDTHADVSDPGESGVELPRGPITVGFDDVSFAYPGGDTVLHDVSLRIAPRSRVAIVGETGSGKSTLAKLLTRLMDPSSGRGHHRRRRPATSPVRVAAQPGRPRAAGGVPLRRVAAGEHPVRRPGGDRGRRAAHGDRAGPRPVAGHPPAGAGHRRRPAGRVAVGGGAAARGAGPGLPRRPRPAGPRRGDVRRRPEHRGPDPAGARQPDPRPDARSPSPTGSRRRRPPTR